MSYSGYEFNPNLGTIETDAPSIIKRVHAAWSVRERSVVDMETILRSPDGETWASNIIQSLITNLSYDGSAFGRFGTPDRDILRTIIASGNNKNLWVKLLGIKMRVLMSILDTLPGISETHRSRVRDMDNALRVQFPNKATRP